MKRVQTNVTWYIMTFLLKALEEVPLFSQFLGGLNRYKLVHFLAEKWALDSTSILFSSLCTSPHSSYLLPLLWYWGQSDSAVGHIFSQICQQENGEYICNNHQKRGKRGKRRNADIYQERKQGFLIFLDVVFWGTTLTQDRCHCLSRQTNLKLCLLSLTFFSAFFG